MTEYEPPEYPIRLLTSLSDYQDCVELQEATWGQGFSERVPVAMLKVSQRLGGIVAGAYDWEGDLVGFVFGVTGWEEGKPVHWSDMLAVRPDIRGSGLGRRLKEYQRTAMQTKGIDVIYWTFDPLVARNAHLNLSRLGAVSNEYIRDMYGHTDSPLHEGIGTDRFVARWEISSPRVVDRLADPGAAMATLPADAVRALDVADASADLVSPRDPRLDLSAPWIAIAIPADIQAIKTTSMELAMSWRYTTRVALGHYLDRGYVVQELVSDGPYSSYVLAAPNK